MCDCCFISDVKMVDFRFKFITCVNPPLRNFMHVLNFFPLKISLLNFTTYTHTQNICLKFEFDLLFTTSEKILDKILV